MTISTHNIIGIMGGTFNPIHYGHLRAAQELSEALNFDEVRFIPAANPPHKTQPGVSALHRAAMVKLAISDNPKFTLDERELSRKGASYTYDTLQSLREELGHEASICLLMGSDAFIKFNSWHRWAEILQLCHIVLVNRPADKYSIEQPSPILAPELQTLLHSHYSEHHDDVTHSPAGHITMQEVTALDISATAIRAQFILGKSPQYLMPNAVLEYIQQHQLYRISNTST